MSADDQQTNIDDLLLENRKFPPSAAFKKNSLAVGTHLYDQAAADDEGFWAQQASELIDWDQDWHTICEWNVPYAKWFVGGKLNVSYNCLDRHVLAGNGDKVAIHWEGEPGDTRTITYSELLVEVEKFSNVLKSLGVVKGDRVNIYLPMIPEAAVAMLSCARIGAAHSVVFGGFSSQALADRINDAEAKVLITADGGYRRGEVFELKPAADEAIASTPTIEHVVVVKRGGNKVNMVAGRDHWYHDLMATADANCPAEPMDSEQLLFLLYTSGTTGKPKGVVTSHGQNIRTFATWSATVGLRSDDNYLIINPFFHSFGYKAGWLASIIRGAHMLPVKSFDLDEVLARIGGEHITVLPGPPTRQISRLPSSSGCSAKPHMGALMPNSFLKSCDHSTVPFSASRQARFPSAPSAYTLPSWTPGVARGPEE